MSDMADWSEEEWEAEEERVAALRDDDPMTWLQEQILEG